MSLGEERTAPATLHQLFSARDRVVYLRSSRDFEGVPMRSLAALAQVLEEDRVPAGATLVAAGEPITKAYFLVEGRVGLYQDGVRTGELTPPSSVALIGVLANITGPPGDIIVEEDSLLLCASAGVLRHVLERDFALLYNTLRTMTREILTSRSGLPGDPSNPPAVVEIAPPDRPLDFVERLKWTTRSLPFASAVLDGVGALVRQQRAVRYPAGTALWLEGDAPDFSALVIGGLVECSNKNGSLRIGSGYTIGYFDGIAERPRAYSATAITDVVVLVGDHEIFVDILEDQFELAFRLLTSSAALAVDQLWRRDFDQAEDPGSISSERVSTSA